MDQYDKEMNFFGFVISKGTVIMTKKSIIIIIIIQVDIDNGIVQITLTNPGGLLKGIKYGGIDNLLELHNQDLNGGYFILCPPFSFVFFIQFLYISLMKIKYFYGWR